MIKDILKDHKYLLNLPPYEALLILSANLRNRSNIPNILKSGFVFIEKEFAEENIKDSVLKNLEVIYEGSSLILDHHWIEARIDGKTYVIDTHLQKRLQLYDNNLVPNGAFTPLKGEKPRFRHFRRLAYVL